MSYDILFVPRRPGQTWDAALDEAEGRDVLGESLDPERIEQYERIVAALRRRVGPVETTVGTDACEVLDAASGLQVSVYPDEASLSFPYQERADVPAFHDVVVDVVALVEGETGLHAWDAQTSEPFDGRVHDETGVAASRRLGQETADTAATEAMAARAEAGALGPDTGPLALPPEVAATGGAGRPDDPLDLAVQRRRALRYVVVGVVVVVAALLLRSLGQGSSTLGGLALALGVADVVIGLLLYRGWHRRAQAQAQAGDGTPPGDGAVG